MFENVTHLDMQANDLNELDGYSCRNLDNLQILDLSRNRIKNVSDHLRAMMNLKILKLENNQLTEFVPAITALKFLEELSL